MPDMLHQFKLAEDGLRDLTQSICLELGKSLPQAATANDTLEFVLQSFDFMKIYTKCSTAVCLEGIVELYSTAEATSSLQLLKIVLDRTATVFGKSGENILSLIVSSMSE